MPDCFVIFFNSYTDNSKQTLIVLRGFKAPMPQPNTILDWYARWYAFERSRLSGYYSMSIDIAEMKYEDFQGSDHVAG